jgi:hypothetical protein
MAKRKKIPESLTAAELKVLPPKTKPAESNESVAETGCTEANGEIIEAIDELRRLEELKKKLLNLEDGYRQKVMHFMQSSHKLKSGALTLATWKNHSRKSFDAASFKTDFPDLHSSYLKDISVRVFRLC